MLPLCSYCAHTVLTLYSYLYSHCTHTVLILYDTLHASSQGDATYVKVSAYPLPAVCKENEVMRLENTVHTIYHTPCHAILLIEPGSPKMMRI
jgi:hypothetical protein